jgi:replicative DNA helicase
VINEQFVNLEAEQAFLGSILQEPSLIQESVLNEQELGIPNHRQIFNAMRMVDQSGKIVDFVTVVTELGDSIGEVGNVSYLMKLADSVPSIESFMTYQTSILEAYRLRRAKELATSLNFLQLKKK